MHARMPYCCKRNGDVLEDGLLGEVRIMKAIGSAANMLSWL